VVVEAHDAQRTDPVSLEHRIQRGGEHRLHVVAAVRDDETVAVRRATLRILDRLDVDDLHAVGVGPGLAGGLPAVHEFDAALVEHDGRYRSQNL